MYVAGALVLAALLGPDFLPPAPAVVFTQVDARGRELGDSYAAICALDTCRATFPADFDVRACVVNAEVLLPVRSTHARMLFSANSCVPGAPKGEQLNLHQSADLTLDRYGATSETVSLDSCQPAANDPNFRACGNARIRVDIVLWTTWRP